MAERTAMERLCPRCQSPLLRLARRAIAVDGCTGCGGVWFDAHELEQLRRQHRGALAFLDKALKPPQKVDLSSAPTPLCPVCRIPLVSFAFQNVPHVTLDGCRQCRGLWTDHGELTQLQAAVRTATAPARPTGGSPCPNCDATNYSTDPVCLSCGANLVPSRPKPVPTPVTPGVMPPGPSGSSGTPVDEERYGHIGAAISLGLDLLSSGRMTPWRLVDSALDGEVIGVGFARFRERKGSRATFGEFLREGLRNLPKMAPFMLWLLLMLWLAYASLNRAFGEGDAMNALWLVVLIPLGYAVMWILRGIDVMWRVQYIRGDYVPSRDARRQLLVLFGTALGFELLMFLVWPANAALNLVAVLATGGVMAFYYVKRDLFAD